MRTRIVAALVAVVVVLVLAVGLATGAAERAARVVFYPATCVQVTGGFTQPGTSIVPWEGSACDQP